MTTFKETRDFILFSYELGLINDNDFLHLYPYLYLYLYLDLPELWFAF